MINITPDIFHSKKNLILLFIAVVALLIGLDLSVHQIIFISLIVIILYVIKEMNNRRKNNIREDFSVPIQNPLPVMQRIYDDRWRDNDFMKPSKMNFNRGFDENRFGYSLSDKDKEKRVRFETEKPTPYRSPQGSNYEGYAFPTEKPITEGYRYEQERRRYHENAGNMPVGSNNQYMGDSSAIGTGYRYASVAESYENPQTPVAEIIEPYTEPYSIETENDQYVEDIFTQRVGTDLYSKNMKPKPVNGIRGSEVIDQDFIKLTKNGNNYTYLNDKNIIEPVVDCNQPKVNRETVFDGRFTGYSSQDRAYVDPDSGQVRFMYDDVNNVLRPNYIVRSKVDNLNFADQFGTLKEIEDPEGFRDRVEDEFITKTNNFRADIMESLMRKKNSEMWMNRIAPSGPQPRMMGHTAHRKK